ncbi:MAG: hypothetical protein IJ761_08230 [Bacteroidales bacterium]|nr:hypothetical protein [Bacteroidales bacterium]MBR1799861.1 hypothetical protein [Bacteroidales bacterium]
MASIDCVVDTQPMAREIDKVSHNVNQTKNAVIAMQMAVIQAEKEASDHVCSKVNLGFYTMIRSQISQKMAKLQSDVDSLLMQLSYQQKQLMAIKMRMERDYNMLLVRYNKLFNGLNQNLKQRVYELDRPTMDFAENQVEHITNRTKLMTATVPLGQTESVSQSQKILASNAKYQSKRVIDSMTRFLSDFNEQRQLTSTILLEGKAQNGEWSVPVIVMQSNVDKNGTLVDRVLVNENAMSTSMQQAVRNTFSATSDGLEWKTATQPDKETSNEFAKLVERSNLSDRVKNLVSEMYRNNNYATLK